MNNGEIETDTRTARAVSPYGGLEWTESSPRRDDMCELYRFAKFGRLASGIFHDLMNPLNAVIANIQQAEDYYPENSEARKCVARAVEASRRMGELLGMIKKELHEPERTICFCLNEEIAKAIMILNCRIVHSGVIVQKYDPIEIRTFGNSLKFHQVALNLIANAIDACETTCTDKFVIVKLETNNDIVYFSVSDTGSGIVPEIRDSLFVPFFTTKIHSRGLGLGLSITKEIIEKKFNGSISVESELGRGSTFRVEFPIVIANK